MAAVASMVMGAVSSAAMAATMVMAVRAGRVVREEQRASGDLQEASTAVPQAALAVAGEAMVEGLVLVVAAVVREVPRVAVVAMDLA